MSAAMDAVDEWMDAYSRQDTPAEYQRAQIPEWSPYWMALAVLRSGDRPTARRLAAAITHHRLIWNCYVAIIPHTTRGPGRRRRRSHEKESSMG